MISVPSDITIPTGVSVTVYGIMPASSKPTVVVDTTANTITFTACNTYIAKEI
jgi:hypothetical protein